MAGGKQREHRRPGAGYHRGDARRAQAADQVAGGGHRRRAVILVQPVFGGVEQFLRPRGEGGDEQRRAFRAASACGTRAGSSPRAASVDTGAGAMIATGLITAAGSSRTALAPVPVAQAIVSPPYRHGATLSGWPSSALASASAAAGPVPAPASARAASTPATIAAAEEPRPRPCGIWFTQRS